MRGRGRRRAVAGQRWDGRAATLRTTSGSIEPNPARPTRPTTTTAPELALSEHVLCIGPLPPDVAAILDLAFAQLSVGGEVEVEVATALAVLMTDVLIRDAVLSQGLAELDRPWLPMLISCATWTPGPLAPALCSVLAMVAYRHGDGALAQVAIDRCLLAEPEHGLAQLMIAIMSAGIHPDELERIAHDEVNLDELDPDWS